MTTSLFAEKIGCDPKCLGVTVKEVIHVTPELLQQISEDLLQENIAMVDIDPETFDIEEKPKPKKPDPLDDVEFISENGEQKRKKGN